MSTPDPPPYPWLPPAALLDHLKVDAGSADGDAVERARAAAAAAVQSRRRDLWVTTADPDDPSILTVAFVPGDDVVLGAVLLAARLYARTGSPIGVASFGEFAAAILRSDPDIGLLVGIGRYARPVIG